MQGQKGREDKGVVVFELLVLVTRPRGRGVELGEGLTNEDAVDGGGGEGLPAHGAGPAALHHTRDALLAEQVACNGRGHKRTNGHQQPAHKQPTHAAEDEEPYRTAWT